MRLLSAWVTVVAIACSGGSSTTKTQPGPTETGPTMTVEQKQAGTCKSLCASMGRCAEGGDWDSGACQAACTGTPLKMKHLLAYDGCAAKAECSAFKACVGTVRLAARQDKTCQKVCDRNNQCAVENANKSVSPEKAKELTKPKILRRNHTECMAECMEKPKTAGNIKAADLCLAKASCADYTKCATGGNADE